MDHGKLSTAQPLLDIACMRIILDSLVLMENSTIGIGPQGNTCTELIINASTLNTQTMYISVFVSSRLFAKKLARLQANINKSS